MTTEADRVKKADGASEQKNIEKKIILVVGGVLVALSVLLIAAPRFAETLSFPETQPPIDFPTLDPYQVDEKGIPVGYYKASGFLSGGTYAELATVLDKVKSRLSHRYTQNVFDCSESSAYVEWALEQAGYDARIVVGPSPDNAFQHHAWVIVYTRDNHTIALEATYITSPYLSNGPAIIPLDHPHAEIYYHGYERMFNDIYAAARRSRSVEEWDWWNQT